MVIPTAQVLSLDCVYTRAYTPYSAWATRALLPVIYRDCEVFRVILVTCFCASVNLALSGVATGGLKLAVDRTAGA